jgi:NAD(P)-dependent dehydrogenase (short-subunit alcohol dehydrogenase family)
LAGLNAIVTGGGSGIGAALVRALVTRGAHVTAADLDEAAAVRVAEAATGHSSAADGSARGVQLDVTDAMAVQALVDDVVARDGRLDLMFNNAGITFGGETDQLTLTQWNAIIDVNIRGVVHGIAAAYPVMIRQGHGQIVNTASMGGLLAAGLLTSYVMTKHAVVGLSLALRSEAAGKGVGVTVLCPAAVETPILDKGEIGDFRGRDYYLRGQGVRRAMDPDELAESALDAVAADRAMLVAPRQARILWRLGRLSPALVQHSSIRFIEQQRRRISVR